MRTMINFKGLSPTRRARGVTLVELLVAMVISLIAITAIFQVFSVFEGQKRTTMGGGEAQTNGALALFTLERELRQAGYGFNSPDYFGCTIQAWDESTGGADIKVCDEPTSSCTLVRPILAPVQITQGAGGAPDMLSVLYGNADLLPQAVNLIQDMATSTTPLRVTNRFGFQRGDVIILAETGKDCSLKQVQNLPAVAGQKDMVLHVSGDYIHPKSGLNTPTRYNKPGGLPDKYSVNGRTFNLGQSPTYNIYTIGTPGNDGTWGNSDDVKNQLAVQQMLSGPTDLKATTVYDGIVQLQAQYGNDDGINNGTVTNATYAADDGIIDNFSDAPAANWAQVSAVRLAIVARSNLREKADPADGLCKITTVAPSWAGGTISLAADPNWQCYRYKVFETVVPIRNMIWRP